MFKYSICTLRSLARAHNSSWLNAGVSGGRHCDAARHGHTPSAGAGRSAADRWLPAVPHRPRPHVRIRVCHYISIILCLCQAKQQRKRIAPEGGMVRHAPPQGASANTLACTRKSSKVAQYQIDVVYVPRNPRHASWQLLHEGHVTDATPAGTASRMRWRWRQPWRRQAPTGFCSRRSYPRCTPCLPPCTLCSVAFRMALCQNASTTTCSASMIATSFCLMMHACCLPL